MRLKVTFESISGDDILLPLHYNQVLQALFYNTLSEEIAKQLHTQGFPFEKRRFKLFVYSRIQERAKHDERGLLRFGPTITLYFSSPVLDLVQDFGTNLFTKSEALVWHQKVRLSSLEAVAPPQITNSVLVKMLSPCTIYSTKVIEGKRQVYYYRPYEEQFSMLVRANAIKKYKAFLSMSGDSFDSGRIDNMKLSMIPANFSIKRNEKVVYFKDTVIRAYTGVFQLSGDTELLWITYEAGLGDKNSQGFGMWDVYKTQEETGKGGALGA